MNYEGETCHEETMAKSDEQTYYVRNNLVLFQICMYHEEVTKNEKK